MELIYREIDIATITAMDTIMAMATVADTTMMYHQKNPGGKEFLVDEHSQFSNRRSHFDRVSCL